VALRSRAAWRGLAWLDMVCRSQRPVVSVVIPCFNAERWLRDAVCSALDQTGVDVEVIVVDDGSTDASIATIVDLDARVRIEPIRHRGANHARNRGLAMATGDHIQYLDADDLVLPGKFAAQVGHLAATGADVSYCDWRFQFDSAAGDGSLGPIERPGEPSNTLAALLSGWWFALAGTLLTRSAAEQIGPWDETLSVAQDSAYWTEAAYQGLTFAYLPDCYATYRRRPGSQSVVDATHWTRQQVELIEQFTCRLSGEGRLDDEYRRAIAQHLLFLGRRTYLDDRRRWRQLVERAEALHPDHASRQSTQYRRARRLLGIEGAEVVASAARAVRRQRSRGELRPTPPEWWS
jgi:hypothetical protein